MSTRHAERGRAAGIGGSLGWTYRSGRHQAAVTTVRSLLGDLAPGGIVIGTSDEGQLVPVRLFRTRPTRVAVVGSPQVAAVLALRSVAVGASVHVSTSILRQWEPLATASQGAMTVVVPGRERQTTSAARATASRPRLLVVDASTVPRQLATAAGPHCAAVTLIRSASPVSASVLRTADIVVIPGGSDSARPAPAAALAALSVSDAAAGVLAGAGDDTLLVVSEQGPVQLRLQLTGTEQHYLQLAGHLW